MSELTGEARTAIRKAARTLTGQLDDVHGAVVHAALQRVPLGDDGSHLVTSLSDMATANLLTFVATVGGRLEVEHHAPLPEERKWAANLARAGRAPDELLAAYRTLQAEIETQWRQRLRQHAVDLESFADADAATSQVLFRMVDLVLPALMQHHADTVAADPPAIAARRGSTIRRLLSGAEVDLREASARLHYELDRWHVAVAARVDPGAPDLDERLDRVGAALERATGRRALATRAGDNVVHVWCGADAEPADFVAPEVPGAILAVGRPGHGVAGFRRSRFEAVRALDLAVQLRQPPGSVTAFADVEVMGLLYADPAEATRFVEDVLGPLHEADATMGLVDTMAVLYEEHLNSARAAERLGVHRNTITYRLRRVLELTGEDHPFALRLRVAIALAPLVLADRPDRPDRLTAVGR